MAAGDLYRATARQGNMKSLVNNIARLVLRHKLGDIGNVQEPGITEPVDVTGTGQQDLPPEKSGIKTPGTYEKFDPGTGEAGSQSSVNDGRMFIPRINVKNPTIPQQKKESVPKYDPTSLKDLLGETDDPYNQHIKSSLQDFITYASGFEPEVSVPFIQQATNLAALKSHQTKQYDEGQVINQGGNAVRMIFDPGSGKTLFVPITDDKGNVTKYEDISPSETVEPNYVPFNQDGKLSFINMNDPELSTKSTEINWEDYNTNPVAYAKLQEDMTKAEMKGSKKTKGSSSVISNKPGEDQIYYNGKLVTYMNAGDFGIPVDLVKNFYSGNAKLKQKAKNQLSVYGQSVSFQAPTQGTEPNKQTAPQKTDNWSYPKYAQEKLTRRGWWSDGSYWDSLSKGTTTKENLKKIADYDLQSGYITQDEYNAIITNLK